MEAIFLLASKSEKVGSEIQELDSMIAKVCKKGNNIE
jgi:hypothetical protein